MLKQLGIIALFFSFTVKGQVGGRATYQFLNTVTSPKVAALGGYALSIDDADLEMTYFNPALLTDDHHQEFALNYTDYFADINYGYAGYARKFKKLGIVGAGIKYIHYGSFIHADELGTILGDFTVSETAAILTWSNAYKEVLRYGVNLKFVYSNFFLYNSTGILFDVGARYKKPGKNFVAALVVKNIGTQITTYSADNFEPLPFEIQMAFSQKLKHAPFRFSLNINNLQQPNIWYESPNNVSSAALFINDSTNSSGTPVGEAILRHFTFGVEVLLTKNFELRVGYNHQRRQELVLKEGSKSGTNGFSFGFGLKIKKFRFDFARSIYSLAGATNHIGITTNFSELLTKSVKKKESSPEEQSDKKEEKKENKQE